MIVMDSREPDSLKDLMRRSGLSYRIKKLPAFDYIINDKIGIERKCYPDLVGSVVERRLHKQLDKMIGSKYRPYVLIEGHIAQANKITTYVNVKGDCEDIARGAMVSIAINYGVPILHSFNQYETVEILKKIDKTDPNKYKPSLPKPRKKISNTAKVLNIIDGVGVSTAVNIVNQIGHNLNTYNINNLVTVTGVGKKTAEKIMSFLGDIVG